MHLIFLRPVTHRNGDHLLVQAVRDDPAACAEFILTTLNPILICTIAYCTFVVWMLASAWHACGDCLPKPGSYSFAIYNFAMDVGLLRGWHVGFLALHAVRLPGNVALLAYVRRAASAAGSDAGDANFELERVVTLVTSSAAWVVGQSASKFQSYVWVLVGLVLWGKTKTCSDCPWLPRLTICSIALTMIRGPVIMGCFQRVFPSWVPVRAWAVPKRELDAIPVVPFAADDGAPDDEACCAICLGDFVDGELLRRLPCNHAFHRGCVDRWLQHNRRCPLCTADVGEADAKTATLRRR